MCIVLKLFLFYFHFATNQILLLENSKPPFASNPSLFQLPPFIRDQRVCYSGPKTCMLLKLIGFNCFYATKHINGEFSTQINETGLS